MYDVLRYICEDYKYQREKKKEYLKALKGLPGGSLSTSIKHGHSYYYHNTKGGRHYLGKEENITVQKLKKKKFLMESLKRIECNLKLEEEMMRKYRSINPNVLQNELKPMYRTLPKFCFDAAGVMDIDRWGKEEFIRNENYPSDLRHITNNNDIVRSKSEVIIANLLQSYGIKYRYEQVMYIGGYEIAPDFILPEVRGKNIILLEHIGMINDQDYRKNFIWKINLYLDNGYIFGKNLFFTFDDENGNIDSLEIKKMIEAFFI